MADDNGEPSDDLVPAILDTAHQYNIQVSLQEEIECPLAHSGGFPSSAHRDSASTQVLGMSPAMANKKQVCVGGGVLINTAYVTLVFRTFWEKSWENKYRRNGRLNIKTIEFKLEILMLDRGQARTKWAHKQFQPWLPTGRQCWASGGRAHLISATKLAFQRSEGAELSMSGYFPQMHQLNKSFSSPVAEHQ